MPTATIQLHVDRIRRRNPGATPAQVLDILTTQYLRLLQGAGGAVGVAAALPAVGTATGVALSAGDVGTYFTASAAYALAVADVHGVTTEDPERRRALLLATVLGPHGSRAVTEALSPGAIGWGRSLLKVVPRSTVKRVNKALTGRLVRHQVAKQSGLFFGRLVPLGIGAAVGIMGARALGRTVVTQSALAFGPPPTTFRREPLSREPRSPRRRLPRSAG